MWLDFQEPGGKPVKGSTMVVAVSTSIPQYKALYSQARELADYMLKKMKFNKTGIVRTSAFPPEVLVRDDGVSTLPECSFYASKGEGGLILFAGDTSPMDDQHEFARFLLTRAKEMGVKELFSVGARWAENPLPPEVDPVVSGFATDAVGVANLGKHGVKILSDEPAPFFSSMVVAMAKDYGIRGYKLSVDHGEPSPHGRSVTKLLDALTTTAGFDIDLTELRAKALPTSPPRQTGNSTIYQ